MIILGINGSPRKGGNTELLLDRALRGAEKAGAVCEKINLGEIKFSPCLSCKNAKKTGECIINDEMKAVFQAIKRADGVIMASPVYFGSVSAQMKMMIDRFQCYWAAIYQHKTLKPGAARPGIFLCAAAGENKSFFENARSVIRNLFVTLNVSYSGELFCAGLEAKGDVLKRKDYLEKAEKAGFDLVFGYKKEVK